MNYNDYDECPTCMVPRKAPCVTASGKPSKNPHKNRPVLVTVADNEMDGYTRQRERYLADRDAKRAKRKERRDKVAKAIHKAGSAITVLQTVAEGTFHSGERRMAGRADRRQMGNVASKGRGAKRRRMVAATHDKSRGPVGVRPVE